MKNLTNPKILIQFLGELEKEDKTYFTIEEIDLILNQFKNCQVVRKKDIYYYNIPCSFDIETSSFYQFSQLNQTEEKVAIMYEWTLALFGYVIIGRTWSEFLIVYNKIVEFFQLNKEHRLIIYIHNLGYEFQFFRKIFEWDKVFSLELRKPVQAITIDGVEFRCSYLLSGYSLYKLSEQLTKYKIKKLKGNLNYEKIRHCKTPLLNKELLYCINDCLVVVAYILETIEKRGGINNIPLTKTGYVREYCRYKCLYENDNKYKDKFKKYRKFISNLTLDLETYEQLKRAFAGGFTHANPIYSGDIMKNVKSYDFTSSYPYVMISEKFPMSKPERINKIDNLDELFKNLDCYCCLFDCTFYGLESKYSYDSYISKSHCWGVKKAVENNGRVKSAEKLSITLTEQDFNIIYYMYDWESIEINNFKRFKKSYLPKDLILAILKLYKDKTELKDIQGKEIEYLQSKEYINSVYGMCVTDICKDEMLYINEEWTTELVNKEEILEKHNKSIKRFLYYPWGVWVTAYARTNLFTGIIEFNDDYCYSDTDSIKVLNAENHQSYIDNYNEYCKIKIKNMCDYYNIDFSLTEPMNKKGEKKPLGIWSDEGIYKKFKTLGAKRYLTLKFNKKTNKDELSLTVSGLNKEKTIPYLIETYGDNVFDAFSDGLLIPPEYTGKMTHTYIDEEKCGIITDYLGNKSSYRELSSVHLSKADYSLSIADMYAKFLLDVKDTIK